MTERVKDTTIHPDEGVAVLVGEHGARIAVPLAALPREMAHWSLTTLRQKLVKIGARMVRHGRYIIFQMAEVAVSARMFGQILARIARLRAPPVPA